MVVELATNFAARILHCVDIDIGIACFHSGNQIRKTKGFTIVRKRIAGMGWRKP